MAKNETPTLNITWQLSNDALRPKEAPWGFIVQNPVQRALPPGAKMTINLNVATNHPMWAFPSRAHQDDVVVPQLIQAGQEVIVTVENKSKHVTMVIDDREALVNLHPLITDHSRITATEG